MARRVGIELSRSRCALIDLDVSGRATRDVTARVRTFRTIAWNPDNSVAAVATLRALRDSLGPARAVVAVWGIDSTCLHLSLPSADDATLRAQALREARMTAPFDDMDATSGVLVDDVPSWRSTTMREATVVTAPAADLRARLAPLAAAGFTIEAAITPVLALASLSRLLQGPGDDTVRAYVAVNAEATAVAIVRHGLLLLGREIPLPFNVNARGADADGRTAAGDALEFVRRLAPELRRSFLAFKQQSRVDVAQVFVCGQYPDLRALTAPLMQSLQAEVATLDSTQGLASGAAIDADIRDRAGELRVAWAAAADLSGSIDLRPRDAALTREPAGRSRRFGRAAAVLVVFAVLFVFGREAWMRADNQLRALRDEVARLQARLHAAERARAEASRAPSPAPPALAPRPLSAGEPAPLRVDRRVGTAAPAAAAAPAADPVIQCILYAPDRRLALIGGHVVRVGDRVDAGVIADIEPKAVIVRRPSGELRRVEVTKTIGGAMPPAATPRSE
jgi:Tfp pilus assembly PilM family ATPase